jgi:hypothetical protein
VRHLLAVSADIDGFGRLRDSLTRAKISMSMVIDGKQTLDFARIVQPEAAVMHLSPSCAGVARAVAGLRAADVTRELPLLLVLDKATAPGDDGFYASTVGQLLGKSEFRFTGLPEEIARVIG